MEDDQLVGAYAKFRNELRKSNPLGERIPFEWLTRPKPIPGIWMLYYEMVDDHARELANIINLLLDSIEKICCWEKVLLEYGIEEQFYLVYEFVEPLCMICLNLP